MTTKKGKKISPFIISFPELYLRQDVSACRLTYALFVLCYLNAFYDVFRDVKLQRKCVWLYSRQHHQDFLAFTVIWYLY